MTLPRPLARPWPPRLLSRPPILWSAALLCCLLSGACRDSVDAESEPLVDEAPEGRYVLATSGATQDWTRALLEATDIRVLALTERDLGAGGRTSPMQGEALRAASSLVGFTDTRHTDPLAAAYRRHRGEDAELDLLLLPSGEPPLEYPWLSPTQAREAFALLAEELAARYPDHAAAITANRDRFLKEWALTEDRVARLVASSAIPPLLLEEECWRPFFESHNLTIRAAYLSCGGDEDAPPPSGEQADAFATAAEPLASGMLVVEHFAEARPRFPEPMRRFATASFDPLLHPGPQDAPFLRRLERNALNLALAATVATQPMETAEAAQEP